MWVLIACIVIICIVVFIMFKKFNKEKDELNAICKREKEELKSMNREISDRKYECLRELDTFKDKEVSALDMKAGIESRIQTLEKDLEYFRADDPKKRTFLEIRDYAEVIGSYLRRYGGESDQWRRYRELKDELQAYYKTR